MFPQQPLKEPLYSLPVTSFLQEHINNFTILINSSAQIILFTLDLHEYLINQVRIAIPLMLSSLSMSKFWPELVAPQTNRFIAQLDAKL